ncbi:MAG: TetR/AcrR family transcriptional regulator C-terminal domain-containing protein [Lactobacillus crispatus]|nr:TetR/AcrR family transcriptional regulator C-terminal domain-containing protein [Lactobacillus crispatus]
MSLNQRTKEFYAEALKQLLKNKTLDKIKVKDLCEYCNTTRTTFYYHFQDKYDLVAWIFNQDYDAVFFTPEADMTEQTAVKLLERMYENRNFYKKVFTDHSQNSIQNYLHNFNIENGKRVVKFAYGIKKLSNEQMYLISHFSYGTIQMLIDWLLEKYKMEAKEVVKLQYQIMPDFLKASYVKYYQKYY